MNPSKFNGRLTAPLAEFLSLKVAEGTARGREPEGRRGSIPAASLEAADALADAGALTCGGWRSAHDQPGILDAGVRPQP
jgi:hypothetical protein